MKHQRPVSLTSIPESQQNLKENIADERFEGQNKLNCQKSSQIKASPTTTRKSNIYLFLSLSFLRIAQILVTLCWILLLLTYSARYFLDTYIQKVLIDTDQDKVIDEEAWENRDDITYYARDCNQKDVTGYSIEDIQGEDTTDTIMEHGVSAMPSIISHQTAFRLRNLLIKRNKKQPIDNEFELHEPDNRWSMRLDPSDSKSDPEGVVKDALKEIAEHGVLKTTLEDLLGPDPGVMELAIISSEPSAIDQPWHGDVWYDGSNLAYARSFTALYSLFIYLQDTSYDMGSTGFYLGSHQCAYINVDAQHQQFEVDVGDGFLFNSQINHRGSANNAHDKDDGTRVMLVLTFTSRPRIRTDPRFLALGSVYGIPWHLNGHNFSDLLSLDTVKWNALHALGILKGGAHWGWSYLWTSLAAYTEYASNGLLGPEWWYDRRILTDYIDTFTSVFITVYLLTTFFRFFTKKVRKHHVVSSFSLSLHEIIIIGSLFLTLTFDKLFSKTELAQSIQKGTRFHRVAFKSMSSLNVTLNYLQSVTLPKANDVLYGDRLDAYYLFEHTYFYDYHPGNKLLRHIIKRDIVAEEYYQMPDTIKELFLQSQIINHLGDDVRFLQQNEYGHWSILNQQNIYRKIRLEIYTTSDKLYKVMLKEISFILSQCKYGNGARGYSAARVSIDTAMMKTHIPALMHTLRRILFPVYTSKSRQDQYSSKLKLSSKKMVIYPKKIMFQSSPSHSRTRLRSKFNLPSNNISSEQQGAVIISQELEHNLQKFSIPQSFGSDPSPNTIQSIQNSIDYMNSFYNHVTQSLVKVQEEKEEESALSRSNFNEALNIINLCKNTDRHCSYWAAHGICDVKDSEEYLWLHCKPSCNWCYHIESEIFDFDEFLSDEE